MQNDVATGADHAGEPAVDPVGGLADQIMGDDAQGIEDATPTIDNNETPENEPNTPEGSIEDGAEQEPQSSEEPQEGDDTEEPSSEEESSEEEKDDEPEEEPEEDENEEEPVYNIGNEKYTSVQAIVGRANELMGRNANFVGENKELQSKVEALQKQIDHAHEVNKQWQDYYDENNTDADAPPVNKDGLVSMTKEEFLEVISKETQKAVESYQVKQQDQEKSAEYTQKVQVEHTKVSEAPNFAKISNSYWNIINNKVNDPLTNKPFESPARVYDYLCKEYGLVNHYDLPKPEKREAPKPIKKEAVKRPTTQAKGSPKASQKQELDEVDQLLDDHFPTM